MSDPAPLPPLAAPAALPVYPGADNVECRACGCVPAAYVPVRGHRGVLVYMQFRDASGVYCRSCGLETFRRMTADTLIQGWWGLFSFFITPCVVLFNLVNRSAAANLPEPRPAPGGRAPLPPGPPLLRRPAAVIGLMVPLALLVFVVASIVG